MALKEKDLIICQTFKLKTILKLDSQSLKKSKHDEKQDLIKKLQIKMIIKLVWPSETIRENKPKIMKLLKRDTNLN